mmetsp:Transcript_9447/g.17050  ORF Transcript_9447/g.17050 Transcript_9447/m.17050 type:complete len:167 (+) Transcript_9447:467-967(+)
MLRSVGYGGFSVIRRFGVGSNVFKRGFADVAAENKLRLNFVLPHLAIKKDALVDMVVIPASSGMMGVLPQHAPTVAQMRPGILSVHSGDTVDKYFVSSGFTFVHNDRTDVCAIEAVSIEDIDPQAVSEGLSEAESKMSSASSDLEKAEAQIAYEVYTAMNAAVTQK